MNDDAYNTGLALRLSCGADSTTGRRPWRRRDSSKNSKLVERPCGQSLTLGLSGTKKEGTSVNGTKRVSCKGSDDENGLGGCRKKLRLSKEQSAVLEEKFRVHTTLNPKQKLTLAKQLSLRPRQVEVWFQNRRARTKLKQIEVECDILRRCCERLTEENRRLHRELQELKVLKVAPVFMPLQEKTFTVCPSCDRATIINSDKMKASSLPKKYLFLNPLGHSSTC